MRITAFLRRILIAGGLAALALPAVTVPGSAAPIINGEYADSGPWAVAIMVNNAQNCSGSIIKANWVITAKHCDNASNQFLIGDIDRTKGQSRRAIKTVKHPSADIVLYQLDSAVQTEYAKLASVAPKVGDQEQPYGFGRTESARDSRYLKTATMRITSVSSQYIDATQVDGYTGPGDSGGPVFSGGVQIGVHSYGDTNAGTSGHTNVATYKSWIDANAR
ncbi:trypsin [Pseudonocardiaceae bacterium YIM PH 21723]|nr:trypsin [Pseudonocardiaceae bacterium YIM PH 21723]